MSQSARTVESLARSSLLRSVRERLDAERLLADAIAIQQIPAPTFDEARRAAYVAGRFADFGLQDVRVDALHNAYGRWPGAEPDRPALLLSAHTDTVFPLDTDLAVRRENGRVFGPGLGDNSLGVAGLLAVIDALRACHVRPPCDLWFVANSREEGLGDLGGIRAVYEQLGARLGAALVVEGMALGRVYHAGIAVRRWRIACHAPGGHSWLHFGQPSAVHGIVALGARILALTPPAEPRTTYNIGLIEGGQSVNSLAASASLVLDLRSERPATLAALEDEVLRAVDDLADDTLIFEAELVGDRPAGWLPRDHALVQMAAAAVSAIHRQPIFETGSTDANVLLASGLPTVTVGVSHGGHAHRLDEFIELGPARDGVWHLTLLALAAAQTLHTWDAAPA